MTSLSLDLQSVVSEPCESPSPVVGILGGMGSHGTLMFMQNVLRLTPAKTEAEHVRMVVDSNPGIPKRDPAQPFNEESPFEPLLEGCRRLCSWPVDAIAIPSNSANFWHNELQRKLKVPLFNVVEVTIRRLKSVGNPHRAVVLSDDVPSGTRIYQEPLQRAGIEFCPLTDADREMVQGFIEAVRLAGAAGDRASGFTDLLSEIQRKYGVDAMILACAELTAFQKQSVSGCVVVDSSEALAHAVVDFAFYGRPLEFDVEKVRNFWDGRARKLKAHSLGLLQAGMFTRNEAEAAERWETERREVSQLLSRVVHPSDEILEPGCGTGRWTRELVQMGRHVVGFDRCREFIEVAKDFEPDALHRSGIEYLIGGVAEFHTEQQFDGIFVSGLLQYLSEPELCQFKKLLHDQAKPGSWLCIKQTIALDRRIELRGFFSETMEEEYSAIYRTEDELLRAIPDSFTLVDARSVFSPTSDKPETCQKAFLFRRLG